MLFLTCKRVLLTIFPPKNDIRCKNEGKVYEQRMITIAELGRHM